MLREDAWENEWQASGKGRRVVNVASKAFELSQHVVYVRDCRQTKGENVPGGYQGRTRGKAVARVDVLRTWHPWRY